MSTIPSTFSVPTTTVCFGCSRHAEKVFQWRTAVYCKDCTQWLIAEKGWDDLS